MQEAVRKQQAARRRKSPFTRAKRSKAPRNTWKKKKKERKKLSLDVEAGDVREQAFPLKYLLWIAL